MDAAVVIGFPHVSDCVQVVPVGVQMVLRLSEASRSSDRGSRLIGRGCVGPRRSDLPLKGWRAERSQDDYRVAL